MPYLSDEKRQQLIEAGFPEEKLVLGIAEELLGELPEFIDKIYLIQIEKCVDGWCIYYRASSTLRTDYQFVAKTLESALSNLYIYLANEKLL